MELEHVPHSGTAGLVFEKLSLFKPLKTNVLGLNSRTAAGDPGARAYDGELHPCAKKCHSKTSGLWLAVCASTCSGCLHVPPCGDSHRRCCRKISRVQASKI